MTDRDQEKADRRALLLVLLLVIGGAGGGLGIVWYLTREAPKVVKLAPPPLPPKPAAPAPPSPEEDEEDRLFAPPAPEDMPYPQFAAAMGFEPGPNTSPELQAFGAAVQQVPELKAEIEKCKRTLNQPPSKQCLGRDLLEKLEKKQAFQELSTSAAFQGAFQKAVEELVKTEEGKELVAVAQASGGRPSRELAKALKGKKRQMRALVSTFLATVAAMQREEAERLFKSSGSLDGKHGGTDGGEGDPLHDVDADLAGLSPAITERIKKLLEVYPWLKPLGVPNLLKLEEAAPKYGLYGACFSLLLHFECWDACKSDPTGKCRADKTTWDPWDACHDWKGAGEESDKVCISRCLYQSPCVVPPPVWTHYCVCRKGCCNNKGECGCCISPYHSHYFCRPAWEGMALTAGPPNAPLPPEMFYPMCSSFGEGANHCDCCYDSKGYFAYDERDPHEMFGGPFRSYDGSACGGGCSGCGPLGCIPAGAGPTQTQERAKGLGPTKAKKFVADNSQLEKLLADARDKHDKDRKGAEAFQPRKSGEGPRKGGSGPGGNLAVPKLKGALGDEVAQPEATAVTATDVKATAVKTNAPPAGSGPIPIQTQAPSPAVQMPQLARLAPRAEAPMLPAPQAAAPASQPIQRQAAASAPQPAQAQQPAQTAPRPEQAPEPQEGLGSTPALFGQRQTRDTMEGRVRTGNLWLRTAKVGGARINLLAVIVGLLAAAGCGYFVWRLKTLGFFDIKPED